MNPRAIEQVDTTFLSAISAWLSWLMNDVPLMVFGAQLSVLVAGFAGAMAIVSFLPKFESSGKMWATVAVCTTASAYLTRLALHTANLDNSYSLAMAFLVAFVFQLVGTGLVQHSATIWEAIAARIRGSK